MFNIVLAIVRGVPAMLACYALGTAWFMALTGTGFAAALLMCVVPFIPGDLLKVAGAGAVCEALLRYTRTRGRGG
ncbi:MAG: biotin transporter BioY [Clostridiales bacterium]|nr:biotin transporter BioY [Clostridiales bacterium]